MASKTVRLIFPEWQGGVNPNYAKGAEILALIAPQGNQCETFRVPVSEDFDKELEFTDGFYGKIAILAQQKAAYQILEKSQPDKILTFGGDCSVSQAPFDYLHGKYQKDMGILWIDAHPDISEPEDFSHEHAMVLGNLLGGGAPSIAEIVKHPFTPQQVMYAGLIESKLMDYEAKKLEKMKIAYATPADLADGGQPVIQWLKENKFKYFAVHFDLDALSPKDFYSLLCNEPHTPTVDYAVGQLTLADTVRMIADASKEASLVGLTIAEYLPWDIINIRKEFAKLDIFND
ncbi:arginase family protein [Dehalobacterium formicoaceticum]|uniref:arginase family protein n=1 Tax=Dehalobacterium formicoaceticum TaxID=51515 RepID=UPI000B7FC012|nr:arginase family protein [Dehalobacterium formicoaceticum]